MPSVIRGDDNFDSAGAKGFGSWQTVSRAANTVYQNTTDGPIQIYYPFRTAFQVSADNSTFYVVTSGASYADTDYGGNPIVPAGHYYKGANAWTTELR